MKWNDSPPVSHEVGTYQQRTSGPVCVCACVCRRTTGVNVRVRATFIHKV